MVQSAEMVLDAPGLPDDFYINLLDWSSANVVAIGLGQSVHLWNCNTGAVDELVQGDADVTSLSWEKTGRLISVGLANNDVQLWSMSPKRMVRRHGRCLSRFMCYWCCNIQVTESM